MYLPANPHCRTPSTSEVWKALTLAALAGEDRAALSGRPRKANASQYERRFANHAPLAALAGEDRAALSGRPRKAIASQYEGVMQPSPR